MDFAALTLRAAARSLPELRALYGDTLGLAAGEGDGGTLTVAAGPTRLAFAPAAGEPFYHLALLVPGDRFAAALEWARGRVPLLAGPESGEVVFDFAFWDALACYFEDATGNIVELIAHRGVGERGRRGPFSPGELLGLSEIGLVGERAATARALAPLGLEVWDGAVEEEGRLAFVGERARTLILCPPGRPWLPTGRPAEAHPVDAVLTGQPAGGVNVGGHRIRRLGP